EARLVLVLQACQLGERFAVVAQCLVLGVPLHFSGILQDQPAVLGVASPLVTLHAQDRADLGPDFFREVVIDLPGTRRSVVRLLVPCPGRRGISEQGTDHENQRTRRGRHREPSAPQLSAQELPGKTLVGWALPTTPDGLRWAVPTLQESCPLAQV